MSNDPYARPPVCPYCGATSEDMMAMPYDETGEQMWKCPTCDNVMRDDALMSVDAFRHYKL